MAKQRSGWSHLSREQRYGKRWKQLREQVLRREPLCRPCNREGRTTMATAVDHVKPKIQGGTDDLSNLQPICARCHAEKNARERGYIVKQPVPDSGW